MNPRCAPKRIFSRHSADQSLNVCRNRWPASLAWPRLPRPEGSKALAVPSHHGVRLDDHYRPKTAGPEAVEQNPEGSVELRQADLGSWPALKDFQLVTKRDDLDLQISSPSEAAQDAVEKGTKDCVHALNATAHHRETLGFLRRMEFMGGTATWRAVRDDNPPAALPARPEGG